MKMGDELDAPNIQTSSAEPNQLPLNNTPYQELRAKPAYLNDGRHFASSPDKPTLQTAGQCHQCHQCHQCNQCHQCFNTLANPNEEAIPSRAQPSIDVGGSPNLADGVSIFAPFIAEEEFEQVSDELSNLQFYFGAISTDPALPVFQANIDVELPVAKLALQRIVQLTGARYDLVSCHLNLQPFGLDGAFHSDSGVFDQAITHSLCWYVHPYPWPIEYGGFLLIGEDPHKLRAILPSRNLAVLIEANRAHCACSPSRMAGTKARLSLALKLRIRCEI